MKTRTEIASIYSQRAKRYDFTANLYYLLGFREWAYRKKAVHSLNLSEGDVVVDLCCGTGLNFSLLEQKIGPSGKIIGVDLTGSMLEEAERRIRNKGWGNVVLVHSDAASFLFPQDVDGILSSFGITLVPEYDTVIRRGYEALRAGGRWTVLDFRIPGNALARLTPLAVFLTKDFAVTQDIGSRHPWESVRSMGMQFNYEEIYGGFAYIASGAKGIRRESVLWKDQADMKESHHASSPSVSASDNQPN